jgi:hypothetical protein
MSIFLGTFKNIKLHYNLNMVKDNISKIKDFLLKNEQKIVIVVIFCLISAISYEFGVMKGQKLQQKPLVIEKPIEVPSGQQNAKTEALVASGTTLVSANQTTTQKQANASSCAFVGSKNSNKFYLPTCSYAKRVKPENLVCFKTVQEATSQGRTESKCK